MDLPVTLMVGSCRLTSMILNASLVARIVAVPLKWLVHARMMKAIRRASIITSRNPMAAAVQMAIAPVEFLDLVATMPVMNTILFRYKQVMAVCFLRRRHLFLVIHPRNIRHHRHHITVMARRRVSIRPRLWTVIQWHHHHQCHQHWDRQIVSMISTAPGIWAWHGRRSTAAWIAAVPAPVTRRKHNRRRTRRHILSARVTVHLSSTVSITMLQDWEHKMWIIARFNCRQHSIFDPSQRWAMIKRGNWWTLIIGI